MADDKYIVNDYSLEHIRNRHETAVAEIMRDKLALEDDFCGCRICIEDVFALTLNVLPPHYVQTTSIILKKDRPSEQDVNRAVEDAIDKVKVRPNHP